MKSLLILSLFVGLSLANRKTGMFPLCPDDTFNYTRVSLNHSVEVNSVYLLDLTFKLESINYYSIDEFINFYKKGMSDELAGRLENIKISYNQKLLSLYSEKFILSSDYEKTELFKSIYSDYTELESIKQHVSGQTYVIVKEMLDNMSESFKLFNYLAILSTDYLHNKYIDINDFTEAVDKISVDKATHQFAFSGETTSSIYFQPIIKHKKFTILSNSESILVDWEARGLIKKTVFLPFHHVNYNETDDSNCIYRSDLPLFFRESQDSPSGTDSPDYETTSEYDSTSGYETTRRDYPEDSTPDFETGTPYY